MKVLFLALGPEVVASSRTRVHQYLPHLRRAGYECRVITFGSAIQLRLRPPARPLLGKVVRLLWRLDDLYQWWQAGNFGRLAKSADVLFIQKALLPLEAQRRLRLMAKPIVFDFDDALFADRRHYDIERFDHQLRLSDLVVLENEHTRQYAERLGCRTLVITGPIDTDRYVPTPSPPTSDVTLGWIGSETTLPHLMHVARALVRVKLERPQVRLKIVAAGRLPELGLPAEFVPWSLSDEVSHLQSFDVGLMPLPDDEWARGKGGYKLLQYMACGLPCVASPIGVNSTLVIEGETGFLAGTEADWVEKLIGLIDQPALRQRLGQAGRRRAESEYSFQAASPKLQQALEQVVSEKRHGI